MPCTITDHEIQRTIDFHGHSCPGLAIGIRAVKLALRELKPKDKSTLVAVVETDMCGVDAIQALLSCTYGKGNLIHRDYGKMAFSFYDRESGKSVRMVLNPDAGGEDSQKVRGLMKTMAQNQASEEEKKLCAVLRERIQNRYLDLDLEEMFSFGEPLVPAPRPAKILNSLTCADCGEAVMESRTRQFDGQTLCIPCFAKVEQKI